MDEITMRKNSVSFMTKKDFIERKGSECFSVSQKAEDKLKTFRDEDILAIDVAVNSPAVVEDISKVDGIVDFINNRFISEGLKDKEINESFDFEE